MSSPTLNALSGSLPSWNERERAEIDALLAGARLPDWLWIATEFRVFDAERGRARPFVVFPWIARFVIDVLPEVPAPLPFSLAVYSTVKKSGKTALNAAIAAAVAFNRVPDGAEIYTFANSKEQSVGRVFSALRYAVERNARLVNACRPLLKTSVELMTGTAIRALAAMHANVAGSNPFLSCWTELWGYEHENEVRAWHEMTPPPTIVDAMRVVDTYAGYEGESSVLNEIEDRGRAGVRRYVDGFRLPPSYVLYARGVVADDPSLAAYMLPATIDADGWGVYPYPLPITVDNDARQITFWDEGAAARRMPWQTGERGARYYRQEARVLVPNQFRRLHENRRAKRGGQFVSRETWLELERCEPWRVGDSDPVVLALDAATKDDHMSLVGVRAGVDGTLEECFCRTWSPVPGVGLRGEAAIDPRWAVAKVRQLQRAGMSIALFTFDPFQFYAQALALAEMGVDVVEFNQGAPRLESDSHLRRLILEGDLRHTGGAALALAVESADAMAAPGKTGDLKRIRIVKGSGKVDPLVALSMAAWKALSVGVGVAWEVLD